MTLRGFYPISDFTTALRVRRCALGLFYKIFTPLAAALPCVPRVHFHAPLSVGYFHLCFSVKKATALRLSDKRGFNFSPSSVIDLACHNHALVTMLGQSDLPDRVQSGRCPMSRHAGHGRVWTTTRPVPRCSVVWHPNVF